MKLVNMSAASVTYLLEVVVPVIPFNFDKPICCESYYESGKGT
jgi:hypothetical protein